MSEYEYTHSIYPGPGNVDFAGQIEANNLVSGEKPTFKIWFADERNQTVHNRRVEIPGTKVVKICLESNAVILDAEGFDDQLPLPIEVISAGSPITIRQAVEGNKRPYIPVKPLLWHIASFIQEERGFTLKVNNPNGNGFEMLSLLDEYIRSRSIRASWERKVRGASFYLSTPGLKISEAQEYKSVLVPVFKKS